MEARRSTASKKAGLPRAGLSRQRTIGSMATRHLHLHIQSWSCRQWFVNPDRHYFAGSGSTSRDWRSGFGLRPDRTYKKICIIFSNIVVTSDVNYRNISMLKVLQMSCCSPIMCAINFSQFWGRIRIDMKTLSILNNTACMARVITYDRAAVFTQSLTYLSMKTGSMVRSPKCDRLL